MKNLPNVIDPEFDDLPEDIDLGYDDDPIEEGEEWPEDLDDFTDYDEWRLRLMAAERNLK